MDNQLIFILQLTHGVVSIHLFRCNSSVNDLPDFSSHETVPSVHCLSNFTFCFIFFSPNFVYWRSFKSVGSALERGKGLSARSIDPSVMHLC